LADLLDSPLIVANYSRLLLDLNRALDAPDSIVANSENIVIPGNQTVSEAERLHRQQLYAPFHDLAEHIIANKRQSGNPPMVISIHSFTPVYHGKARPWHIGVLSNTDRRLADTLISALSADPQLIIGDNEPYAPTDGVYHSMQLHGEGHGLPCVMLEIRNDLITDSASQMVWAERLANAILSASSNMNSPLSAQIGISHD
jgi:predicted N-formylglutamate amidohydrolase